MVLKENEDASSRDFPEQWYDAASEDHFWMEWRARVLSEHLLRVGLDPMAALSAFDIGCGHGAVQRQLTRSTAWIVDGCDLNDRAISRNTGHRGFTLRYNIFDKSPDLRERYDIVFLLDVIEHVKDPVAFLNAAAYYLKPTGVVVINVPSVPSSRFCLRQSRRAFAAVYEILLTPRCEGCGPRDHHDHLLGDVTPPFTRPEEADAVLH